jgi:predicted DCC family thiol-disulfide oxidoreductase YuxK
MAHQVKNPILTVYFDGLCRLCAAEIEHYRKQEGADQFRFVDITHSQFSASTEGVDPVQVHKIMHVRNQQGELKIKVAAFIEIWKNLPRYKKWVSLAEAAPVRLMMNAGYEIFAAVRPYLPRKKRDCEASPYCDI